MCFYNHGPVPPACIYNTLTWNACWHREIAAGTKIAPGYYPRSGILLFANPTKTSKRVSGITVLATKPDSSGKLQSISTNFNSPNQSSNLSDERAG